jgi:hypothetical protein
LSMLHVDADCPSCISIMHIHFACPFCMSM